MLTTDLVRSRLHSRNGQLYIKYLDLKKWQQTAHELIYLWQTPEITSAAAWEAALTRYEGERTDYVILRGLGKVLSDAATFGERDYGIDPAELRMRLFQRGPAFQTPDLFSPQTRADVLAALGAEVGMTVEQVEAALYADRPGAYQLLDRGRDWTPAELIARYNLELARAALYSADEMTIELYDNFKDFWKYLKLFKLMFEAIPIEGGYQVALDGPISPFVQSTTRYGRQFAGFLPALLLGERWSMQANVQPFGKPLLYRLDQSTTLKSHFKHSAEYDSRMEADFAAEFRAKFGDERGKWTLTREDEVLIVGDRVMIPDFAVTHADGRRALIEIMGFWHPQYLKRKLSKIREAGREDLLLLVYEGVNLSAEQLQDLPSEVLYFKKKPVVKEVLAALERIAK